MSLYGLPKHAYSSISLQPSAQMLWNFRTQLLTCKICAPRRKNGQNRHRIGVFSILRCAPLTCETCSSNWTNTTSSGISQEIKKLSEPNLFTHELWSKWCTNIGFIWLIALPEHGLLTSLSQREFCPQISNNTWWIKYKHKSWGEKDLTRWWSNLNYMSHMWVEHSAEC